MIATVLLAAGQASRFGSPKLLAEWWGRPLVEHALDVAPDDGPRVAVVGRETVRLRPLLAAHGFAAVVNPRPSRGLAASLRLGLEVLPAEVEAALILLGDAPVVPPAAIERVLAAYRRENRAVGASYDGRRGHPVLLPRADWERLPKTGERAGAALDIVPVECGDLAEGAADVDTPDDLFEIAARAAHAPLVARLRNLDSLEARLGLPEPFVLRSIDGEGVRTREVGEFQDEVLVDVETLRERATAFGRGIDVIARAGDEYAALVG
jgi:CTP:molybdopterin cytidylyltransferase MocA